VNDHTLGNALEGLLRSDAWRAVEAELRSRIADAAEDALAMGAESATRQEKAGYWNGLRDALNLPGMMLENARRGGDE